jgi:CBS domain-containing protein
MAKHPTDPSAVWTETPPPTFEHATVRDAMRPGLIEAHPWMNMQSIARMMASYHVHSVVVSAAGDSGQVRPWGVITDVDVLRSAAEPFNRKAGECITTELVTVGQDEPLERAAKLMDEHGVTHLIAVDPERDRPVGVVSTLDIARVVGFGLV